MEDKVIGLIREYIQEIAEDSGASIAVVEPGTRLFGKEGCLDSIGLVNLVSMLEQGVDEEFDAEITIADERAMSMKQSPFRTVQTLSNYVVQLVKEAENE